ncbi:hypothetical protein DCS_06903 [Drechmeria coniospora]|uniref:Uncharacterized protein n=1 Tax=Drechmeria coniospora TaxID=98403 RepID=A0A151GCV8_DRECN|nr:hypothetical protein DCS_06903 [Drechmeria coniospora]KYK54942.1 hypothetical protein DCS_06903 [Drechmeria coniospora]
MQDYHPVPLIFFILAVILTVVQSSSLIVRSIERRKINPLNINTGRAPNPYNEPGFSAGVVHDPKRLPAEIGGIVAAYGISLVLVAIILLSLSRKRRQHLRGDIEGPVAQSPADLYSQDYAHNEFARLSRVPVSGLRSARALSFSYPPPIQTEFNETRPYIYASPTFSAKIPGVDPSVDQRVVRADRKMAQNQLEEMYKHVMEHEEAKQKGIVIDAPTVPGHDHRVDYSTVSKKGKKKPALLELEPFREEKTQSKASFFFSAIRSPRKKSIKGLSISAPIMTPQSSTFPRQENQEMSPIAPRLYAPSRPPPSPANRLTSFGVSTVVRSRAPPTANISPESVMSIDERIKFHLGPPDNCTHSYSSPTPMEIDPTSAISDHSQRPLVGISLPASPKSGARSPSLPSSPSAGTNFPRSNHASAVRAGGTLPLRAYEPPPSSPSVCSNATKQTVFQRTGPLSPTTGQGCRTAGTVPYSPYQPFTPCIPVTPSLVTKEERKRLKRMAPRTPTVQMVQNADDVW